MNDIEIKPLPVPTKWWKRLDELRATTQTDDVKEEISYILDLLYKPTYHVQSK